MGLIDELGFAEEIWDLYKQGNSPEKIKELLIQNHTGKIPTAQTIYNWLKAKKEEYASIRLTQNPTVDFDVLEEKEVAMFRLIFAVIPKDKRKELYEARNDYDMAFKQVKGNYVQKDEIFVDKLDEITNLIVPGLCKDCQDRAKEVFSKWVEEEL